MSMPPIPWRPDRKTLGEFSEGGMFALGMVLAPLAILRGNLRAAALSWGLAVLVRLVGLLRPGWLRPAFVAMTAATWPVGWAVSNLALALLYYGVVTPIGLVLRLRGRDPMGRTFDRRASTYWRPSPPDRGAARYFRPF